MFRWLTLLIVILLISLMGESPAAATGKDAPPMVTNAENAGPTPWFYPMEITFPAWTKASVPYDRDVILQNIGDAAYNYSLGWEEDPGPLTGWLSASGFTGFVDISPNNADTGTVTINPYTAGAVAGEIYRLTGRLIFTSADPFSPLHFEIDFIVADTVVPPTWDTIATACTPLALQVCSDGLFGGHNNTKGVGLDYYPADCDTTATPYLYSGSPIITWIDGADTIGNWTIYQNDYLSPHGFYPLGHTPSHIPYWGDSGMVFQSTFVTRDSSIAIEKTWLAPQEIDSCNFVVQQLRIYSNDGSHHPGLTIGEAVDWDIPSDSFSRNGSDFNEVMNLIWQFGGEYGQDDATECQESDARYGGIKLVGMAYDDGYGTLTNLSSGTYSAYTADNATWVYPNPYGFDAGELYTNMSMPGWMKYTSTDPDSLYTDLHTVMTFVHNYDLPATGALLIWTAFISIENGSQTDLTHAAEKAQVWTEGVVMPVDPCPVGDFDCDGQIKVSDLTALIAFLFRNGPWPIWPPAADCNCDGTNSVADLTFLIAYLFRGGPPPPC